MRFGLYWNCNSSMTTPEGMQHRKDDARYLFEQFKIDFYRTDGTDGNVLQTGNAGPGSRAHYAEDLGYWQTKGLLRGHRLVVRERAELLATRTVPAADASRISAS